MKHLSVCVLGLCGMMALIIPGTVVAQESSPGAGTVGFGYDFAGARFTYSVYGEEFTRSAGATGLSVRYWTTDRFAIQGVVGLVGFSPSDGDGATDFSFGAKFLSNTKSWERASLHVGAGVGIYMTDMGDEHATDIGIQGFFGGEFFPVDNIGLETDVGLEIAIWDEDTLDGTSYQINGDLLGNISVHIYIPQ